MPPAFGMRDPFGAPFDAQQHFSRHQKRRRFDEEHHEPQTNFPRQPHAITRNQPCLLAAAFSDKGKLPAPLHILPVATEDQRSERRDRPNGKDRKSTRLNSSHGYISYA